MFLSQRLRRRRQQSRTASGLMGKKHLREKGRSMADLKYLNRLAKDYPNIMAASAEIINLKAILALPKGTEYF